REIDEDEEAGGEAEIAHARDEAVREDEERPVRPEDEEEAQGGERGEEPDDRRPRARDERERGEDERRETDVAVLLPRDSRHAAERLGGAAEEVGRDEEPRALERRRVPRRFLEREPPAPGALVRELRAGHEDRRRRERAERECHR